MSLRRSESGQTMALYAITLLLLSLITLLTISVGVRVREKIKVQAASDISRYSWRAHSAPRSSRPRIRAIKISLRAWALRQSTIRRSPSTNTSSH